MWCGVVEVRDDDNFNPVNFIIYASGSMAKMAHVVEVGKEVFCELKAIPPLYNFVKDREYTPTFSLKRIYMLADINDERWQHENKIYTNTQEGNLL